MRATTRVLSIFFPHHAWDGEIPHPTTGRHWLLRLGCHKLHRAKEQADDWVWLIDHTVQIGAEKCLAIVGIRLADLPQAGICLEMQDLEPIALLPVTASNGQVVHEQLEDVAKTMGIPREILSDEGSDLRNGIKRFCNDHPHSLARVDMPHKAARLLKKLLEKDQRWSSFLAEVGETKPKIRQTELAHLMPPQQRSKARYMNLESLLRWGTQTMRMVDQPPATVLANCTAKRIKEKLGWLRAYRQDLARWSRFQLLVDTAVSCIRSEGYSTRTAACLPERLDKLVQSDEDAWLRDQLVSFLREQSAGLRDGERLAGSTEILESSFGKLKMLEGDHQQGGFTGLLLVWAALFGETTPEIIRRALISTPTKHVQGWIAKHLGATVQSKRRAAYHAVRHSALEKPEET